MSEGLNRVMLLGNLCADPELRRTQNGGAVLHIRLATNESYLDKDKVRRERTDFHSVIVWGKRGEALSRFLKSGSSIFVEGRLQTSSYDNREGVKVYKTEIVANNVVLAGSRGQRANPDDTSEPTERPAPSRGRPPAPQETPADDYENGGGFGEEDGAPF